MGFAAMATKLRNKAQNEQAGETTVPYNKYVQAGQAALPKLYQPAYQAISSQFSPEFTRARNFLSANPGYANSGVTNRLNGSLMRGAYGQLGQAMAGESAGVQRGGLDLLSQLIQRRIAAQQQQRLQKQQQGGGLGATLGSIGGSALGMIGGPALGAIGAKVGGNIAGKL